MTKVARKEEKVQNVLLEIPFILFGRITVSLPLFGLIYCFVTGMIFQFNEVNETVCNVQNFIPSISAVTGVAPARYVWRICIALHCTPRFLVGFIYINYYMQRIGNIAPKHRGIFKKLVWLNFWLYTVENSCLVLVSYIANWENYPIHEKLFMVFMVTSLVYEFITIILFRWCHTDPLTEDEKFSYKWKKICFTLIMGFTAGLLYFFIRHRFFCQPIAFSYFSLSEYGIAITNIGFHYTGATDFKGMQWYVGLPSKVKVENNHKKKA